MDELLSAAEVERLGSEKGLSVKEICRRAGIAHTTFYRWKAGTTEPTLDVYRRLREVVRASEAA